MQKKEGALVIKEGALVIIKTGSLKRYGIYRGTYFKFYKEALFRRVDSWHEEDPLVFTVLREDGTWHTRHYFLTGNSQVSVEWLT